MASSSSAFPFVLSIAVLYFVLTNAQKPDPKALIFNIRKDAKTLQYYSEADMGSAPPIGSLFVVRYGVLDLGGTMLWLSCDKYNSTTYHPIPCGSSKCTSKKCTKNNACVAVAYNPFQKLAVAEGLGEDTMSVSDTDGGSYLMSYDAPHIPFSCVGSKELLKGLASAATGIIGLGRTETALHKQLSLAFKLPHKFAICVPSSTQVGGDLFIGGGPYYYVPAWDQSKSLATTPLIDVTGYPSGPSSEYFIGVKSIKVGGKNLTFDTSLLTIGKDGVGGTKISSTVPYTILQTSIYNALKSKFVKKAASKKMKQVPSVAPFGACFSSKAVVNVPTGPVVPVIDLVMEGEKANWRIFGANSMVEVKKDVLCLGFVDGGLRPRTSIVLGGLQLEDNLLEFDLASSKLGFSNTLKLKNTTCSVSRIF